MSEIWGGYSSFQLPTCQKAYDTGPHGHEYFHATESVDVHKSMATSIAVLDTDFAAVTY